MMHTGSLFLLGLLGVVSTAAWAQLPPVDPDCGKDATRGITCSGNPPTSASPERLLKLMVAGEGGSYGGFVGGFRYDHDMRGSDNLAHADFSMGLLSTGAGQRTVANAEVMATFGVPRAWRPVLGIRHRIGAEISEPLAVVTGLRVGRPVQHAALNVEVGAIYNRVAHARGFGASMSLSGHRSFSFAELSAALRAGVAGGAGGMLSVVNAGVTKRLGSQLSLRGEWTREQLAARGSIAAAGSDQFRVGLRATPLDLLAKRLMPARSAGAPRDHSAPAITSMDGLVSPDARATYLATAKIHSGTPVEGKNVFEGDPRGSGYGFREEVHCTYGPGQNLAGNTPKFECVDDAGKELKVKYGCDNGEVFSETAATRLLWLLGFEADRIYPVVVNCKGCPPLRGAPPAVENSRRFECAIIEKKTGSAIESIPDEGWHWDELNRISAAQGGASRAHVDALRLMAVLLQHNDSKEENQRMICLDEGWSAGERNDRSCGSPFLIIQDVGTAFGGAGNRVREDSKVNLVRWREQRIWRDGKSCIANLAGSTKDGTISDPQISEEGRAFLAGLLQRVSAAQIHDLFRVAQFTTRDPGTTVEEWERAFWYKAWQIVNHRCP